ncbi:hypothetical protein [Thermococcus prieurii]
MVRETHLFFLILLIVLSVIPHASANLVVIPGKDDAFIVHWWAGENGELGMDFYHFINGTLQPFYRTCLLCNGNGIINDWARLIPNGSSWIFLRSFYVPKNDTRVVEAYRVQGKDCTLIGRVSLVLPPETEPRIVVYYQRKAFAVYFENGSEIISRKFLIRNSLTPVNFSGFPEETPVYYAMEKGVPLGGFYVSGDGYAYNGSRVVLVPLNVVREIVSLLKVKGDIRDFASAVLKDGVILYYPYNYHVNGSPMRDDELSLFYYPTNGGKLKVFKLGKFQNGSGFAPEIVCSEKPEEKRPEKGNSGICGPASLLVLTLIPAYRAFRRKYS